MKSDIHPTWYDDCVVTCACGNTWTTGATVQEIRTDICSACHPFFTGEQRIVDTEGRVDVFMRRLQARDEMIADAEKRKSALTPMDLPLSELGLSARYANILAENGIVVVEDFLKKISEEGDEGILAIHGIGRKALADLRKALLARGYVLEETEAVETE